MPRQSARTAVLLLSWLPVCAIGCSAPEPGDDTDTLDREFVSNETTACITNHPASEPFDVGDVNVSSPAPMSGAAAPSSGETPSMMTFVAQCQSARGTNCNEVFISKDAARCIAQSASLEPGLEPWTIALGYTTSYQRVIWSVENLLVNNGAVGYSGKSLTLDAATGRVLGRTGWMASE